MQFYTASLQNTVENTMNLLFCFIYYFGVCKTYFIRYSSKTTAVIFLLVAYLTRLSGKKTPHTQITHDCVSICYYYTNVNVMHFDNSHSATIGPLGQPNYGINFFLSGLYLPTPSF